MVSVVGPGRSAKCALFLEVPDFELEGYTGVTSCAEPSRVSDVSGGNCTFFLGRPLRFLGGTSVSTSAALDSPVFMFVSGDLDRAALLTGVPFRFGFGVAPTSDFLGRPRGRLTGDDASWSFNGTVVVFVLVTRFTDGDSAFTSSLPGSAWTVTVMRQRTSSRMPQVCGSACSASFAPLNLLARVFVLTWGWSRQRRWPADPGSNRNYGRYGHRRLPLRFDRGAPCLGDRSEGCLGC
jgi:hypothetical protein